MELYKNGHSLSEISKLTGKAKSAIRDSLIKSGIEFRQKSYPSIDLSKSNGKTNIQPPYGFCYFQGQLVPDQKEYGHLMLIYNLWKQEANPNRIAEVLNEKKVMSRFSRAWNRNSVVNILNRFKENKIILKGGKLELR